MKLLQYFKSLFQKKEAPKQIPKKTVPKEQKQVSKSPTKVSTTPTSKAVVGKLKYFNKNKGYGFIESRAIQERIFVHISDLQRQLKVGSMVEFQLTTNGKGYQAKKVKRLRKHQPMNKK